MLNTFVTQIRKRAPGSLTAEHVAEYFRRHRLPRSRSFITRFESASFIAPPDRVFELYAECAGATVAEVRRAYARTRQMRERKAGPFAESSLAHIDNSR